MQNKQTKPWPEPFPRCPECDAARPLVLRFHPGMPTKQGTKVSRASLVCRACKHVYVQSRELPHEPR